MSYIVKGYKPEKLFNIFEDICKIPRGSGNERGIARYIMDYAESRGLECFSDGAGNVFVRKPGNGISTHDPVLLQGHMDMVCEKNADIVHDFEKDPLELYVKDGYLSARGTTLGADDGIAVAIMLALLDEETVPLELLFTVEEETGLAGAKFFDCSVIRAESMINIDSEEEGIVTAGCAGGVRTDISLPVSKVDCEDGAQFFTVKISGLAGGHSGTDINSGRMSAVALTGMILPYIYAQSPFNIVSVTCDGKDNAIARECSFTVCCPEPDRLKESVSMAESELKKTLGANDQSFSVSCSPEDLKNEDKTARKMCDNLTTKNVINILGLSKKGVLKMSNQIPGLVEHSQNLGIVKTFENEIKFSFSTRSSLEFQLDISCRELDMLADLTGAEITHHSRYPGWEYNQKSAIREKYIKAYKNLYGKEPSVSVIHAGLECGIFSAEIENIDIISIGPDILDIHSPSERLDLSSCERIWNTLISVLSE